MTIAVNEATGEVVEDRALVVTPPSGPLAARGAFDLAPAEFAAQLEAASANRRVLLDWIRTNLVDGTPACYPEPPERNRISVSGQWRDNPKYDATLHAMRATADYGRIYTRAGWSKPTLFKTGSEKVLGMLRLVPTFPNLDGYEDACMRGVELTTILLRCEVLDAAGRVVAHGVGSAQVKDGDLNKALKMAEKSAQIDATLRCAGISEIFTQDLDDMQALAQQKPEIRPPERKSEAEKYMDLTKPLAESVKQAQERRRIGSASQIWDDTSRSAPTADVSGSGQFRSAPGPAQPRRVGTWIGRPDEMEHSFTDTIAELEEKTGTRGPYLRLKFSRNGWTSSFDTAVNDELQDSAAGQRWEVGILKSGKYINVVAIREAQVASASEDSDWCDVPLPEEE